jgi:hypothetical protein
MDRKVIIKVVSATSSFVGLPATLYQVFKLNPRMAAVFGAFTAIALAGCWFALKDTKLEAEPAPLSANIPYPRWRVSTTRMAMIVAFVALAALLSAVIYALLRAPANISIINSPQINIPPTGALSAPSASPSPTSSPIAVKLQPRSAETYRTQFLHSHMMEDAEWFIDGVKTAPVDPPLPSFTVLLLSRGQHQILAKTVGNICSVRITVPVSEQGVTLKCHSD